MIFQLPLGFKKYAFNTSWLIAEKILRVILGIGVGIWVARYLGPKDFGTLSYGQSIVYIFMVFATLGLDNIVIRELVRTPRDEEKILGTAFLLKVSAATLLLLFFLVGVYIAKPGDTLSIIIMIFAGTAIFQSCNVIDFSFQSKVVSKYVAISNSLALAISSSIKIWLILVEAPLITFAAVMLFDAFVVSMGLIYFYIKTQRKKILNWKFDISLAKKMLADSWPLIFSGMLVSVYMRIDQVMIGQIVGEHAVGEYAAAVKLSEAWYFVPAAIAGSLFPALVNAKKIDEALYERRLVKLYAALIWGAVFVALPISLLSSEIIGFLYGPEYANASMVLAIHVWGGIFVFMGIVFGKFLAIEGKTKKSIYRTLVGAISNIVLNFVLIPSFGIYGAASATLISQLLANYIYDYFDRELRPFLFIKNDALFIYKIIQSAKGPL